MGVSGEKSEGEIQDECREVLDRFPGSGVGGRRSEELTLGEQEEVRGEDDDKSCLRFPAGGRGEVELAVTCLGSATATVVG